MPSECRQCRLDENLKNGLIVPAILYSHTCIKGTKSDRLAQALEDIRISVSKNTPRVDNYTPPTEEQILKLVYI